MAYGYIQTAGNVASQLKKLNRDYYGRQTWGSLYAGVDLQKQQALGELGYDYQGQMAKAYATAYQQKSAIANSQLGSGFKEQGQLDMDAALQEAFNSYRESYLSSAANIESSALQATSQVDALLQQEAQNYVDYEASAYSYLQNLYDRAYPGDDADYDADQSLIKLFSEDPNWSKYVVKEKDAQGNETSRLMTEQELRARNYDLDASGQGTLNKTGVDFYDQMLNQLSREDERYSFHNWLATENPGLYEWSISGNPYDYNEAGTNMGTFKKMMGLQSTDDEYKFIERFGGMTTEEVKTNVEGFVTELSDVVNTGEHKDTKAIVQGYSEALTKLTDYVSKLNLSDEQRTAITETITSLQNTISSADVKNTSDWNTWAEVVEGVKSDWKEVAQDWSSGKYVGSAVLVVNTVANAVGNFVIGALTDIGKLVFPRSTEAIQNVAGDYMGQRATQRVQSNKDVVSNIEQQYLDLMTLLASYAK